MPTVTQDIKMELSEKWGKKDVVNPEKKGMFDGWSHEKLTAARDRLRKKKNHTAAETTRLRELNFALRAKNSWGRAK